MVKGDEEEEQEIGIDDAFYCSYDEGHADDDSLSNSFETLATKVMPTLFKCRSKLIHDCPQVLEIIP